MRPNAVPLTLGRLRTSKSVPQAVDQAQYSETASRCLTRALIRSVFWRAKFSNQGNFSCFLNVSHVGSLLGIQKGLQPQIGCSFNRIDDHPPSATPALFKCFHTTRYPPSFNRSHPFGLPFSRSYFQAPIDYLFQHISPSVCWRIRIQEP